MPEGSIVEGRFRIDAFQRAGRFGDLWKATRLEDDTVVSVKLLKPDLYVDGEAIRRFQREVKLLLSFVHPYLLRVLDHGQTEDGDPFVVLEYREGRLLSEVVADGPLPPDQVAVIGAQTARVLAAAGARDIVHRGLSADAILLVADHEIKVLDFGLARPMHGPDPHLTSVGQRLGNTAYMAPEYIQDFTFDGRTDLYALGVLLYELLTGEPPFVGRPIVVLDAHVNQAPEAPSTRAPDAGIPAWLDEVVLGLLDKSPED